MGAATLHGPAIGSAPTRLRGSARSFIHTIYLLKSEKNIIKNEQDYVIEHSGNPTRLLWRVRAGPRRVMAPLFMFLH